MYCPKCGKQIGDDFKFCVNCGAEIPERTVPNSPVRQQMDQMNHQQPVQKQWQPTYQQPVQHAYQQPIYQQATPSMGWFKFLIYFSLYASAFFNVVGGIRMISGNIYGDSAEMLYRMFDGLQILDTVVGVLTIAMAAFLVYTRFRLAGYYKDGPQFLLLVYVANVVITLLYIIGLKVVTSSIPNAYSVDTNQVSDIIADVICFVVNYKYFKNREYMFTKQ